MPITVSRHMVNQALNIIQEDDLVHFDFRCPKCKKANHVSKKQLHHASPAWVYEPMEAPVEKEKPKPKPAAKPKAAPKTSAKPKAAPKTAAKPKAAPKTKAKPKPKTKK
jgi:outer membrane biosynthesis protein TonB